jgi:hypothetical protein
MMRDGTLPQWLEHRPIVGLAYKRGQHLHDEEKKHG